MNKKLLASILICSFAIGGAVGLAVSNKNDNKTTFNGNGYVLYTGENSKKVEQFNAGKSYGANVAGKISFSNTNGENVVVDKESFVVYEDKSVMSFTDGVLVNLTDVSDNFINNYFITSSLPIEYNGTTYSAVTDDYGQISFGEHIFKISDNKFIIRAPHMKVVINSAKQFDCENFVQLYVSNEGVVYISTGENVWMTFSDESYVETDDGYKVYPTRKIVEAPLKTGQTVSNKLYLGKITVSTDDAIVLSNEEARRQIVPKITINGHNGKNGTDGTDGKNGSDGTDGTDGNRGNDGGDGGNGHRGNDGKDAQVQSSINSALPTISISDWQISANQVKGQLSINDPGSLNAIADLDNYTVKYPGSVVITKVSTGEKILCYQVNENFDIGTIDITDGSFDFYQEDTVYFTTLPGVLEPDQEYRIQIDGYYKNQSEIDLVYQRDFLTRFFYTDSLGVYLSYSSLATDGVSIIGNIGEAYATTIAKADIYILDGTQVDSFTAASISDTSNYVASAQLNLGSNAPIRFNGLEANTDYYCRVYIENSSGLAMLSNQVLHFKTLKRTPTKVNGSDPQVIFNRYNAAFEVYRPSVTDTDNGVEYYNYIVYETSDGGVVKNGKVTERRIYPNQGEPVSFHLEIGKEYQFQIEMVFNDNEKRIYYDLGYSNAIKAEGDTMPKITLETLERQDYNVFNGNLIVNLGTHSHIESPKATTKMMLEITADKVPVSSIIIDTPNKAFFVNGKDDTLGTISYIDTGNTNTCKIFLDLKNLYNNTNYFLTLSGYMSLGDSISGAVYQTIGTVSFKTYDVVPLLVQWDDVLDSDTTFAKIMSLSIANNYVDEDRESYILSELLKGQVTVGLYSGTGAGKHELTFKNFNTEDSVSQLFGDGLLITESAFGGYNLQKNSDYTLIVKAVTDKSYSLSLGYQNDFPEIINAAETVSAEASPPNLLRDSTQGVAVTYIYNKDAATYNKNPDLDLPDDAIIGVKLASSYDNIDRIGLSITYYAFEFKTYFNALKMNIDPITDNRVTKLLTATLDIDKNKNSVPYIAILFGGDAKAEPYQANGYTVYNAGTAVDDDATLISGMGRGYRYIFAYTVEYKTSSVADTTKIYPNRHGEYENYARNYGGIEHNGVRWFEGEFYILNSGIIEVPNILPDFHSYVYSQTADPFGDTASIAQGRIELHYTWRDPDKLLILDGTASNTQIYYNNGATQIGENINAEQVPGTDWYRVYLAYTMQKGVPYNIIVSGGFGYYRIDYSDQTQAFGLDDDITQTEIANIPVEWNWEEQFSKNAYSGTVYLSMDDSHLSENFIDFIISGDNSAVKQVIARASLMKITFQTADGLNEMSFIVPLSTIERTAYIRIPTGSLGTNYLNKEFKVTEAILYYDTGIQGWDPAITHNSGGVFLQQINNNNSFDFDAYLYSQSASTFPANNALLTMDSTDYSAKLRNTINITNPSKDSKFTCYSYAFNGGTQHGTYLYAASHGADSNTSSNVAQLSGKYVVPKKAAAFNLLTNPINGKLTEMTPTVRVGTINSSANTLGITVRNVNGFSGSGEFYIRAYEDYNNAKALNTQFTGNTIKVKINSQGLPDESIYEITGLKGKTKYYLAFYYVNPLNETVLLIDFDTTKSCIKEATTSSDVTITFTQTSYVNKSYTDKSYQYKFNLNRTYNIYLEYDIFATQQDAIDKVNPLIDYQTLDSGDANDILTIPTTLTSSDNKLNLNLYPQFARDTLKPGVTYYLRVSAFENNKEPAGYKVQSFKIDPVINVGALVYVSNATPNSLEFQVSIDDKQFSAMGASGLSGENVGGLYAVRFVDSEGRLIHTIYDNQVFKSNELKKLFKLDSTTNLNSETYNLDVNKELGMNEEYSILLYAAADLDHNGCIDGLDDTVYTPNDLFDSTTSDKYYEWGAKFNEIIDSFWDLNTNNVAENDALENLFLIYKATQRTTNESGWVISDAGISLERTSTNKYRIKFGDSYGLIGEGNIPVFKQIDWNVTGYTGDDIINESGVLKFSNSKDKLIQKGQNAGGYDFYYLELPNTYKYGEYIITIQLRQFEGSDDATIVITRRS